MEPKEDTPRQAKVVVTAGMIEKATRAFNDFDNAAMRATLSSHAYDHIRMAHAMAAAFNR